MCDILDCTPAELIEPVGQTTTARATGTDEAVVSATVRERRPRRAEIRRVQ